MTSTVIAAPKGHCRTHSFLPKYLTASFFFWTHSKISIWAVDLEIGIAE
jgi:hypothetical protein